MAMPPEERDELARQIARTILEQDDLIERIAQSVVQKIALRERVNQLADLVIEQIIALNLQDNTAGTERVMSTASPDDADRYETSRSR